MNDEQQQNESKHIPTTKPGSDTPPTLAPPEALTLLSHYENQLARANQRLLEFANLAAHDLQEPLRKIYMYSQLIEDALDVEDPVSAKEAAQSLRETSARARGMLNDLLTFSYVSINQGRMARVMLADVMRDVVGNLQLLIKEEHAELTVDCKDLAVRANRTQIMQMAQNLVSNAIKYVAPGTVPKIAILAEASEDGLARCLQISDNGIGIEEKYYDKIFEPFARLHSHNRYSGSGLGLAICKAITDNHGWHITVGASQTGGTIFSINFEHSW